MIDPAFIADIKARTSLVELIGGMVTLKRAGREAKGLCPFHKERTPSFYVIEAKGFWHCFGCGASGDAVKWVQRTTTASNFTEAVEYLAARCGLRSTGPSLEAKPIVQRPSAELRAEDEAKRLSTARGIWGGTQVATDWTPVGRYLREIRRIRLPIPPTLRFVPALHHPFLGPRSLGMPAMVAPFQSVERKIVGVHCTYLGPAGERGERFDKMSMPPSWGDRKDWKAKLMRGVCRGAAIRLTAIEDVLVIAEGIETALAVLQALYDDEVGCPHIDGEAVGVWAAGSLDFMGAVVLPDGVREVILAADGDGKQPDAGDDGRPDPEELIQTAAASHRDAGRTVRIARPPQGSDFNDMLPEGAGAADGAAGLVGELAEA